MTAARGLTTACGTGETSKAQSGSRALPGLGPPLGSAPPALPEGQAALPGATGLGSGSAGGPERTALWPTRPQEWTGLSDHTKGPQPSAGPRPRSASTRGTPRSTGPGAGHGDTHRLGRPGSSEAGGARQRSWEGAEAQEVSPKLPLSVRGCRRGTVRGGDSAGQGPAQGPGLSPSAGSRVRLWGTVWGRSVWREGTAGPPLSGGHPAPAPKPPRAPPLRKRPGRGSSRHHLGTHMGPGGSHRCG